MDQIGTQPNQRQRLLSPFLVPEVNFFLHEEDTDRSHPSLVSVLSAMSLMELFLGLPLYLGAGGASVPHISEGLLLFFCVTILCGQTFLFLKPILSNSFFQRTTICRKQANPVGTIYGQCHIQLKQFVVIKYNHSIHSANCYKLLAVTIRLSSS